MKPKANHKADHSKAGNLDCCQTPPYALSPVLPYLAPEWVLWECAAGEGKLVDGLECRGWRVIASDVLTGQDFFEYAPAGWDCIVTNPPYSVKYKWLARCYELGKPFALLLPVETLGAATAQRLFNTYGIEVVLLDKRVNFYMPNKGMDGKGAQFPTAWFTWGLGIGERITFASVERVLEAA
jgi:hypothetical protein